MSRIKLSEAKENCDMSILAVKDILTMEEAMCWYDISYQYIMDQVQYYRLPHLNRKQRMMFSKTLVDKWFRNQME